MKRLIIIIVALAALGFVATRESTKHYDENVSVIFFTANSNASQLDRYPNVTPNSLLDEPDIPERMGYVFNGWFKDFQITEEWDFEVDRVTDESIVLYADWIPTLLNIIYDLNDGIMVSIDYPEDFFAGDFKVLPLARKTGFAFVAWYNYDWVDESSTKAGDRGFQTLPTDVFEDLYLYAHWEPVSVQVLFKVNYPIDNEGPVKPATIQVSYGSEIDFTVFDDTAEYEFLGWNTLSDGTGTFYDNGDLFIRTQRTSLYAIWNLIE